MDCVYCILQAYLNNPWLSFFVNTDDLFRELDTALGAEPDRMFRIGTGEFTDSLALDRLTGLSRQLVDYFKDKDNAVLELKTKSDFVDNLMNVRHGGRSVVAWSLNSQKIMKFEELRTAGLDQRLAAARKCADKGYMLAFHFDPIIYHDNWAEEYRATIRKLFEVVPADQIVWISLGALRFIPQLKTIASGRFPGSRFFYQEFVEGLDGKSRYFRDQRVEMYKVIAGELQEYAATRTCIYFCMESDVIWQDVFGYRPAEKGGLASMLDEAVL
jgi:spore photoproduct lyase